MKKKIKIIFLIVIALVAIPVLVKFVFHEFKIAKRDPLTQLYYDIPLSVLANKDFSLVVSKASPSDVEMMAKEGQHSYVPYIYSRTRVTNAHGISYIRVTYEECFNSNEYVESLDERANAGKQLIPCSDTFGSEQDRYYVFIDNDAYLFTTPFPTRILYHDPGFGPLPQRIDREDFKNIIQSLRKQ